jgi:hypothetical protein
MSFVSKRFGLLSAMIIMLMATSAARAGSPHFVGNVAVDVNLPQEEVTVSGKIAGLGNQDVVITIEIAGSADLYFVNKGGNEAPGQNKAPFHSLATAVFHPDAKNGTVSFKLTADLGPALDALLAGATPPNKNWTAQLRNVLITGVRLTVEQPAGTVVLQQTFTP